MNRTLNASCRTHTSFVQPTSFIQREREVLETGEVIYKDVDPSLVELPDREILSTQNVVNSDTSLTAVNPVVLGNVTDEDEMLNQILNEIP